MRTVLYTPSNKMRLAIVACLVAASVATNVLVLIKAHKPTPAMIKRFCKQIPDSNMRFVLLLQNANDTLRGVDYSCVRENVFLLTPPTYEAAWRGCRALETYDATDVRLCMLPEFTYYKEVVVPSGMQFKHMFVFEQDVAWKGDLRSILFAFDSWNEDFLCLDPVFVKENYWDSWESNAWWRTAPGGHTTHKTETWLNDMHVRYKCWAFAVRYSQRLMERVATSFLGACLWGQVEWYIPTICTILMTDCKVRNMREAPVVLGCPFDIGYECLNERAASSFASLPEGKLYHPIKH